MSIYSEKHRIDENYLRQHLENYCRNENISDPEFVIDKCCQKGQNFVGHVYRVTITGTVNGKSKTVHGILKLATRNETQRTMVPAIRCFFLREILFYTHVVPLFKEADVEVKNIPKLLYTNDKEFNEALMLEDLSVRGFASMKKDNCKSNREAKMLDYKHASLALRHLGKFHAKTFIVREKRPDLFKKLQAIKEPLFFDMERQRPYIHMIFNIMKPIIEEDANEYQKMKFRMFEKNYYDYFQSALDGKNAEPYAAFCHGDMWSSNMMFKYDENCSEPTDINFVDFQICRYTSPILDIVHMIFCAGEPDMRKDKYQILLKDYHDSLYEALEEAALNPENIFSFKQFLQELAKFASYAGNMAVLINHLITAGDDDYIPEIDADNQEPLKNMMNNNEFYKKCTRQLYYDLIENCYI